MIPFNDAGEWDAPRYFKWLLDRNRLAVSHGFDFGLVSGLQGLEDMLHVAQDAVAFFAVSDISDGFMSIGPSAKSRRIKTVFLAMRHAEGDMRARGKCMDIMRELFRQMMTVLSRDRRILMRQNVFIDERIQFSEIDQYFFTGCACAYFQIALDSNTHMCICENEWTAAP